MSVLNFLNQYLPDYLLPYTKALIIFIGIAVITRIIFGIFIAWFASKSQKTDNNIDDLVVTFLKSFRPPFYLILAGILAVQTFSLPSLLETLLNYGLVITLVIQAIVVAQALISHTANLYIEDQERNKGALSFGVTLAKVLVWVIGLLFLLSNLGVNITSLAASLGIGGIAIALALQRVLEDLFSSFSIYFDKPFEVGDFIVVGEKSGVVEKIGIKTTRLRALQGEQIVISNKELTVAQVENFKRLEERRVVLNIGVTYETNSEQMKKIPEIVKQVVEDIDKVRFDRTHFKSFGDSALIFEVVYFVDSSEYIDYMDSQQDILLKIKEKFEEEKIEMAFPTQTLYLKK